MTHKSDKNPTDCFIDVDLKSRQLIGWGTEKKDAVEVHLQRWLSPSVSHEGAIQQAGKETDRVLIKQPTVSCCAVAVRHFRV